MLKIFLITISLSLVSCASLPPFPDWNPIQVIVSKDKSFKCSLVDKDKLIFQCERASQPIEARNLDGGFCTSAKETSDLLIWARNAKKYVETNCK